MGKGILVAACLLGLISIALIVGSLVSSRRRPRRPVVGVTGGYSAVGGGGHLGVNHPAVVGGYSPVAYGQAPSPPPAAPAFAGNTVIGAAPGPLWSQEPDPATEFMAVEDMLGERNEDATQILDDAMLSGDAGEVGDAGDAGDVDELDEDRVEPTMLLSEDMLGLDPPTEPARLKPRLPAPPTSVPAPAMSAPPTSTPAPAMSAPIRHAPAPEPRRSAALPSPTRPEPARPAPAAYQVAPPIARSGPQPSGPLPRSPATSHPAAPAPAGRPAPAASEFAPPNPDEFARPRTREFSTPYVGEAAPARSSDDDDDDDDPGTELVHQADLLRMMGKSSS